MSEEIDTCGTEDLICPYCGHVNGDVDHNAHETICCKCGETFTYEIDYTWTYT